MNQNIKYTDTQVECWEVLLWFYIQCCTKWSSSISYFIIKRDGLGNESEWLNQQGIPLVLYCVFFCTVPCGPVFCAWVNIECWNCTAETIVEITLPLCLLLLSEQIQMQIDLNLWHVLWPACLWQLSATRTWDYWLFISSHLAEAHTADGKRLGHAGRFHKSLYFSCEGCPARTPIDKELIVIFADFNRIMIITNRK